MTLANMRENGVHAVTATCEDCGHKADVVVDKLSDTVALPEAGRQLRCSHCGGKRIKTRPAWPGTRSSGQGWAFERQLSEERAGVRPVFMYDNAINCTDPENGVASAISLWACVGTGSSSHICK
jgi:DNA-directed RNA polymerase subunit RPC12/RpoP